jgi:multimeric flavodoxin WrbA
MTMCFIVQCGKQESIDNFINMYACASFFIHDLNILAHKHIVHVFVARAHCLLDDDMKEIYDALETCDIVVLGSPVYFDTVSAQTKLMIDRCNCLMQYVEHSDGTSGFERRIKKRKKGVFVAVAGVDQEFNTVSTTVKGFFNWANIELSETFLYPHDDNELGSVKNDDRIMNQAFEVGAQIVQH